jgi:hypothetical protein
LVFDRIKLKEELLLSPILVMAKISKALGVNIEDLLK